MINKKEQKKQREYLQKWQKENPEKMKEYYKKYYDKNKEQRRIYHNGLYQKNKEKILKKHREEYKDIDVKNMKKEYVNNNKDKIKKRMKEYSKNNRKKLTNYEKERIKNNPQFNIKKRIHSRFKNAMKIYSKTGKIMSLKEYGIDMKSIINRLKPFPKNRKDYHVDHIIPLKMFNLNESKQIKKAWAPSNLQWLTVEENLKKGVKI